MTRFLIAACFCAVAACAQTLSLSGPATARPGDTVTVDVVLGSTAAGIAALQWDLALPAGMTATAVAGPASASASKTLACNAAATRCITYGVNTNVYANGAVARYAIAIPAGQAAGALSLPLAGLVGAKLDGTAAVLSAGAAYAISVLANTDLNGDGKTDVQDLQILIPIILGATQANCPVPQNADAVCNVLDLQIVARAVVGA